MVLLGLQENTQNRLPQYVLFLHFAEVVVCVPGPVLALQVCYKMPNDFLCFTVGVSDLESTSIMIWAVNSHRSGPRKQALGGVEYHVCRCDCIEP